MRSTLDGFPVEELQKRYPGMDWFLEQVLPGQTDERRARLSAAHAMALQLGWGLIGPSLRAGFGLQDMSDAELQTEVEQQVAKIVTPQ